MRLFRDLKLVYIFGVLGIAVLAMLATFFADDDFPLLIELELCALVFLLAVVLNLVATRRINGAVALMNQAQVGDYLALMAKWAAQDPKNERNSIFRLNWIAGFLNYGDFESAKRLLFSMEQPNPTNRSKATICVMFQAHCFVYYYWMNDRATAEQALAAAEQALAHPKVPKKIRTQMGEYLIRCRKILELADGSAEAEAYLAEHLKANKILLGQASDAHILGKYYFDKGDRTLAEQYLNAAVHMGGDSFFAKHSADLLQKLQHSNA